MQLKEIYRPIKKEIDEVENCLNTSLGQTKDSSTSEINRYLLESPGKRIRPALVILSAKAALSHKSRSSKISANKDIDTQMIKIAAAMELIHMASLIHDDVIDHSELRHNKPTVYHKRGEDVAIVFGDYLHASASELVSTCNNTDVIQCISSAAKTMCEGELLQVCERDNLDLLKERYMVIIKKKTATLFATACQVGSLISNSQRSLQLALREYGLNFGIAFQITDDYLDLMGEEQKLGKKTGEDIKVGEITLPLLNLLESLPTDKQEELKALLTSEGNGKRLQKVKSRLFTSKAVLESKKATFSFINSAKENIKNLSYSPYKESLLELADFIVERGFNDEN